MSACKWKVYLCVNILGQVTGIQFKKILPVKLQVSPFFGTYCPVVSV